MARRLIFAPQVPDDLVAAVDYYEQISPALANDFRTRKSMSIKAGRSRTVAVALVLTVDRGRVASAMSLTSKVRRTLVLGRTSPITEWRRKLAPCESA